MSKYIYSIIFIIIGMVIVIKSEWILRNFGYNAWAEEKFRMWGGTRIMIKFIGLAIIIGATFVMTGWMQDILRAVLMPVSLE